MLEDNFMYVIRKALRGLELAPAEAAARADLEGEAVLGLLAGRWDEGAARKLAPVLGLDADALAAHPGYEPPRCEHAGIRRLDLPFGSDEQVNAWLIDSGDGKLLVDTGCDVASLESTIGGSCDLSEVRFVIITHDHGDHVGGLGLFGDVDVSVFGPGVGQDWKEFSPGEVMACGDLRIKAHDLAGHASPAIGLSIAGLGVPVLAVGDALFAGSMGGCGGRTAYDLAHETLRAALAAHDESTILLPGHGPETRIDSERKWNPFVAAMGD